MKITWYGHAAFLVESEDGRHRIGIDPYCAPDAGSYLSIDDTADMVAVSHENAKYHSYTAAFHGRENGGVKIIDGLAVLETAQPVVVDGIPFRAIRAYENDERTEPVAMLKIELDGINLLHMGDCGHAIDDETVEQCGDVDILLALAGDKPTIALPDLCDFIGRLKPCIVIPMHFGNDKINLNLRPLRDFLSHLPANVPIHELHDSIVTVTMANLPASTQIWVLPPAR